MRSAPLANPFQKRMAFALLAASILAIAACKPAEPPAAPAPSMTYADASEFVGVYVFRGASETPAPCTVTLSKDVIDDTPDVHTASAGEGCTVAYPLLVSLARWEVISEDAIRLLDPGGYALGDMKRDAAGVLNGAGENDGKPYEMTPMVVFARQKAPTSQPAGGEPNSTTANRLEQK